MEKMQTSKFEKLYFGLQALSVYRAALTNPVVQKFNELCELFCFGQNSSKTFGAIVSAYAEICAELYKSRFESNLSAYIYNFVLYDENKFSAECYGTNVVESLLFEAAQNDYKTLLYLAGITSEEIFEALKTKFPEKINFVKNFPTYKINKEMKINPPLFEKVVNFYQKNGFGIFAAHTSFVLSVAGELLPTISPDGVKLSDLKLYEMQKDLVVKNTISFLNNKSYLNILLYGDRGCGKSSTVKAVLNEFSNKKLRLIQIKKENLIQLSKLCAKLAKIPMKFILFIDDLSFNEGDEAFSVLKAMLEGGIETQPKNIMFCATSNRRHLVKETFKSREGDEVHLSDTIDETLSLADRFGLIVNYNAPRKDSYLEIVKLLAKDKNLFLDEKTLSQGAEAWALEKAGRSPRIAQQYIDFLLSNDDV